MNILVTGGAGYIGSHTARRLVEKGFKVTIVDDLSSGNIWAIPKGVELIQASIQNEAQLNSIMTATAFDAVIHFAAFIDANESVQQPLKYFENNASNTFKILSACCKHHIDKFVFSSTAAVYGQTSSEPVDEEAPCQPINPYGLSKYAAEMATQFLAASNNNFHVVSLRYFNVGGAHSSLEIGPSHKSNVRSLIRLAAEAAAGARDKLEIFGNDHDTLDGTCVRDYIHVEDLAEAHIDALDYLVTGGESDVFNVGYGHGHSVLEVIETMKRVSGKDFPVEVVTRRPCDPTSVVANSEKIRDRLGWSPKFDDLSKICKSAYLWEMKNSSQKI